MRFIENWTRHIWRLWSIRLAAIAGMVGAYFVAYPEQLTDLVSIFPPDWQKPVSVLAGLLIFATASGARLVAQGKRGE